MNTDRASQIKAMLNSLPQAAEQGLSGLTAGPHLKARIQLAAAEPKKARSRFHLLLLRLTPVACCAAALALFLALSPMLQAAQQPGDLIKTNPLGPVTHQPGGITADLSDSRIVISASNTNPSYRTVWVTPNGGSFPLVGVNGRYYRMLTSPRGISSSLLGATLGTVAEFTTEPSLSGTDTILSNIVSFGKTIYAVRGMDETLVAAEVDGQMRLFQRVSFNGNARRGRETLADTLQVHGRVIAMELSGVGTITDPAACSRLMDTLFDCASYKSSGSVSSRQSLLLELDNGIVLQMAVKSDSLAACGVWSCPEFFEAFEAACD